MTYGLTNTQKNQIYIYTNFIRQEKRLWDPQKALMKLQRSAKIYLNNLEDLEDKSYSSIDRI